MTTWTKEDKLVSLGDAVKAISDDGKIAGLLVRFGDPSEADVYGDFFDPSTDFGPLMGDSAKSAVLWHHGFDPVIGLRYLTSEPATLRLTDAGVWMEAQLALRDEYEEVIWELVKMGKVGLSSGTAGHLVEFEDVRPKTRIKRWPLGLDASLTPTPAEPRTYIAPMKSLDYHSPFIANSDAPPIIPTVQTVFPDTDHPTYSITVATNTTPYTDLTTLTFTEHLKALGTALDAFQHRLSREQEMRSRSRKAGRRLSKDTCAELRSHQDTLRNVIDGLDRMMSDEDTEEMMSTDLRARFLALRARASTAIAQELLDERTTHPRPGRMPGGP